MFRTPALTLLLACAWSVLPCPADAQRKATTSDGRLVYLFDDGTWRWAEALDLSQVKVIALPTPPWQQQLADPKGPPTRLRLRQISASRNKITDDAAWFREHGLALPTCDVPNPRFGKKGSCPPRTPTAFRGARLTSALHAAGRYLLTYGRDFSSGRYLVIADEKLRQVEAAFDFRAYARGPAERKGDRSYTYQELTWAAVEDGVLYVATGHRTYAASSGGHNAYLTALDQKTGKVRWRSKPLVCNARNFLILDDAIICGYGFTSEPDHLYVLDRASGKVAQRLKLKTGPSFILRKGERVMVRTYNMDYQFKISRKRARKARQ